MATFFSNQVVWYWSTQSNQIRGTLTGNVSRSGNTVTLSGMTLSLSWPAWASGSSSGMWFALDGSQKWSGTMGANTGSISLSNHSFSVSASATSKSVSWSSSDTYSGSFTVTFPSGQVAPATPTCTASSNSTSLVNVSWGTSNLGTPAGTVSLYTGTTNDPTEFLYSKSTTGTGVFGHDQRVANTTYYYKATATNSVGTVSSAVASATTYPAGLTSLTVSSLKSDEATLTAVFASSGNSLTTGVQARINQSGTWDDLGLTDVQGTTQNITLGPFLPETSYTVELRVYTTAGTSSVSTVTFTTPPESKFYGSVDGQAKRITKLYGSVGGQTKKITKLYGSVNGQAKIIYKG